MKTLTIRLSDEAAEYAERCAGASRLSVNKTIESILLAARDLGVTDISMVPVLRRTGDGE